MKRVYLWEPGQGLISATYLRAAALALAAYACNGLVGRVMGDIVFEKVTERRQTLNAQYRRNNPNIVPYSACGDLAHWLLAALGCRNEKLVNRDHDGGQTPWVSGVNIGRLVNNRAFVSPSPTTGPKPGDILCVKGNKPNTEHVCIVKEWNPFARILRSYDYGQLVNGQHGGQEKIRSLTLVGSTYYVEDRYVVGWLDLEKIDYDEGALVPDDFPYGIPDKNPYYDPNIVVLDKEKPRIGEGNLPGVHAVKGRRVLRLL